MFWDVVNVVCPKCPNCGNSAELEIHRKHFERLEQGAYVRDVFPEWTLAQCELLISGIHPHCWEEMFSDE